MSDLLPLDALSGEVCRGVRGVFCDIDDTLTHHGELVPEAFLALHQLREAGLRVVPVTGRPGGWVDHIARAWPVDGVVGENGGLWFYRDGKRMVRSYAQSVEERQHNRARLDALASRFLQEVPGAALASDQSYRDLDLAIDFCEDVPALNDAAIDTIVRIFQESGATCKVSSIHVNGWYGEFDKLAGCRAFVAERWQECLDQTVDRWIYVGDSANDEPMFAAFPHAVGVANVRAFLPRMNSWPRYVCARDGGAGFAELVARLLAARRG